MNNNELESHLFFEAVKLKYGYDFSQYAKASIHRRLALLMLKENISTVPALVPRVLQDRLFINQILDHLLVPVSDLFRDAEFFLELRTKIIPVLASYPEINIWIAGCANGEEAYSVAIAFHEAGLLEKTNIFATDINDSVLKNAEKGCFSNSKLTEMVLAYQQGGTRHLYDYLNNKKFHSHLKF